MELQRLCRDGRLYDVERWIAAGRPLQLAAGVEVSGRRRVRTALEVALERRDQALTLLLVANGYDLAVERIGPLEASPLDAALELRRRDLLEILLDWGADPRTVSLWVLCHTHESELYERFRALGLDLTEGHAMAHELADHPGNKPLFGFAKQHRRDEPRIQRELDLALAHHAGEGNEKGVMLCLWAGADPHVPVPVLDFLRDEDDEEENEWYSALYHASSGGHGDVLEKLGSDATRDDLDLLYRAAANGQVVEVLARRGPPADGSRIVRVHLERLGWWWGDHAPVEALRALFAAGVRWEWSSAEEIADVRRSLLQVGEWIFSDVMELLAAEGHCSPEVLAELARTEAIRRRMRKTRLLPSRPNERKPFDPERPTPMQRQTASRFGIELPTPKKPKVERSKVEKPRLSGTERIGGWRRSGRDLRLDRAQLFERVWSVPVDKLAREWGLSGRGLAKACRRLRVPVPPRGYWARTAAGQRVRRPKLPRLPPGQAEEIVVRVPEPADVP